MQATGEVYVPISPEGEEIKAYVRQPRQQRKPVSYKVDFLEQYRPNQTAYLPESLRVQLHALGRSPAEQAPSGTFARDILNRLLIDLSWASSKLEGNTYTYSGYSWLNLMILVNRQEHAWRDDMQGLIGIIYIRKR